MEIETGRLPKDEQVPLLLRGLFEHAATAATG